MNERDTEVEKAAREMGDLSWQYFTDKTVRPTTLWRLLTVRTWKGRQVPMSEWFDDETKAQERLAHHAANDWVEIVGLDRYEMSAELAALRQQLAEAKIEIDCLQQQVDLEAEVILAKDRDIAKVKEQLQSPCYECNGTGAVDSGGTDEQGRFINLPCEACNGSGCTMDLRSEVERLKAESQSLRGDNEIMLWNLGGCSTYALGYNLDDGHCVDMERPALREVRELALKHRDAVQQLAAQAAELDRLRERCEAAEKAVAFFFECQIAIQLPGGNADETFGFETLRDGRFAVTKWVGARQFFHIRGTPMEAFQDAISAGWLPDSKNKGGE